MAGATKVKKTPAKKPGKKGQVRKTPTLKQKLQKESKVVKVDNLKWKKVDIPDTLDDFEGFYGLEEIDGVDVKVEGGQVQFLVKGEDEEEEGEEGDEEDEEEDQDMEYFAGFDDDEEPSTDSPSTDKPSTEKSKDKKEKNKKEKKEKAKKTTVETTESNTFAALPDVSETIDADLPLWNVNDMSLSSYTINGLAALGFEKPTPIQKSTIPLALEQGKDVIGKASTGSGKTLAYGIPILETYLNNLAAIELNRLKKIVNAPTGIIFAPTRELAHQVVEHLNKLAAHSPLSQHGIVSVTGGLSIQKQERLLGHGPGVIVATPGRFLELLQKDEELIKRLSCTEYIVLDEADRLLQDGHFEEFEKILELFHKNRPKREGKPWKWQTLVFSATFARDLFYKLDKQYTKRKEEKETTREEENAAVINLLNEKLRFKDLKPAFVDANPNDKVSNQISEALVECGPTERDLYLYYFLLMYPGTTLVFTNSIDSVKRLVPMLNNLKIPAFSIHSSMIQKQRLRAIERFTESAQKNKTSVLIASDIAARGLDIPNIDHVAHYHLPRSADVYIHRSGRTARAGKEGVSVMFCSPQESSGPLRKLRKTIADSKKNNNKFNTHQNVKLLPIEMDLITQIKPRVAIASKLADSEISSTSTRKENAWVTQAAEDLGLDDLDEVNEAFDDDILKRMRKRKENKLLDKDEMKGMRYELKQLLDQKLRKNARRSYITSGLENLAHQMVSGNMHSEVLGQLKMNALDDIRSKKAGTKKVMKKKQPPAKVTKPEKKKNDKKDKRGNKKQ